MILMMLRILNTYVLDFDVCLLSDQSEFMAHFMVFVDGSSFYFELCS
jgi:hypothetical protein